MKKEEGETKIGKIKQVYLLYKQNPRFKALIKLILYFVLIFIIFIVVGTSNYSNQPKEENNDKQLEEQVIAKSYKDILEDTLSSDKFFNLEINNLEDKYLISYTINDSIISGIYEDSKNVIKKFIIRDNNTYELNLNEETEDNALFNNMNMSYINIYNLIELLENHKSLKMLEDSVTIYKYEIEDTTITVSVANEEINKIEIIESEYNYKIIIE